jgi:lipoyl-dependent peroxiredoxin
MATFVRHATIDWTGDVVRGTGTVSAGSDAFSSAVTFPRLAGEPPATTTPEELLAASHATCFGIGLRSVIASHSGTAERIHVTASITAEKGGDRIRVRSSRLQGTVEGLTGVDAAALPEIARAAEEACTISALLRPTVAIETEISVTPARAPADS